MEMPPQASPCEASKPRRGRPPLLSRPSGSKASASAAAAASSPSSAQAPDIAAPTSAHKVARGRGRPRKIQSENSNVSVIISNDSGSAPVLQERSMSQQNVMAENTSNANEKKACLKRKRAIITGVPLDLNRKAALVEQFRSEVTALIKYYNEEGILKRDACPSHGVSSANIRSEIALMIEESSLPFSSLVTELFGRFSSTDGFQDLTLASLRSSVLSVGERVSYGVPKEDADVLEDDTELCLWCWEVRDLKLVPDSLRGSHAIRRRVRRKICERLCALSGMIAALTALKEEDTTATAVKKAEDALAKTDSEDMIRLSVSQWQQRMSAKEVNREVKSKEREALKEKQRLDREKDKEKKRLDKEEEKRKQHQEKEKERLEKEAQKEALRQEKEKERLEKEAQKEALRQEKELKRQQEEMEKELKRKEREAAEVRRQAALSKQANLLGRFLQSKKEQGAVGPNADNHADSERQASQNESSYAKLARNIDQEMLLCSHASVEELFSSHLIAWKSRQTASKFKRWGERRLPKISAFSELRLQGGSGLNAHEAAGDLQAKAETVSCSGSKRSREDFEDSDNRSDKSEPEWDESACMPFPELSPPDSRSESLKAVQLQGKRRKLLQFDKSHRPAFYGSYSKKSDVVRPRNPLKLDPNLDYEVDSDEEWEEEDPGESLSDCEKDEEDEKMDAEEDDENADGFVVPDGYLSESEVVCIEEAAESESDADDLSLRASTSHKQQSDQNIAKFCRHRKLLEHMTDQALKFNRPYIICNFQQDGASRASKTERQCLEALKVFAMPYEIAIELPQQLSQKDKGENDGIPCKKPKAKKNLPDSALPEIVEVLMMSSHCLKKAVIALSAKFPTASRSQLKEKVREISEFVDNRWQVKKEILDRLGLSPPLQQAINVPEPVPKSSTIHLKPKPITKFFSKRCLPPENAALADSSPSKEKNNSKVDDTGPIRINELETR